MIKCIKYTFQEHRILGMQITNNTRILNPPENVVLLVMRNNIRIHRHEVYLQQTI